MKEKCLLLHHYIIEQTYNIYEACMAVCPFSDASMGAMSTFIGQRVEVVETFDLPVTIGFNAVPILFSANN